MSSQGILAGGMFWGDLGGDLGRNFPVGKSAGHTLCGIAGVGENPSNVTAAASRALNYSATVHDPRGVRGI